MDLVRLPVDANLEQALASKWDCIWLDVSLPLAQNWENLSRRPVFKLLDWKLRGQLHRFFADSQHALSAEKPIYFPAMKRLNTRFIALDTSKLDNLKPLTEACEGMKLADILVITDHPEKFQRALKESKSSFPARVTLCPESHPKGNQ